MMKRLQALKARHAAINDQVRAEMRRPASVLGGQVQRLKRLRLRLKDEIHALSAGGGAKAR